MGYVLNIAKDGFNPNGADPKNLNFSTKFPCLKFVDLGKREFTINNGVTTTYEQTSSVNMPFLPIVFLYHPTLGMYKPVGPMIYTNYFDDYLHCSMEAQPQTTLYVTITNNTGGNLTTHYYWYIGYA